jgi:hypothetical protein
VNLTGTATSPGGPTPLTIDTQFMSCSAGVCTLPTVNLFPGNFFTTGVSAAGGTQPYRWSIVAGALPAGVRLVATTGLIFGNGPPVGTYRFTVQVRDAAGSTAVLPVQLVSVPAPGPGAPGCQHGPKKSATLSGPAIVGKVPSGQAIADESALSVCGGGFTLVNVSVKNVNMADGTVLWVTLDGRPIGRIRLSGGSGSIKTYNDGAQDLRFDHIDVYPHTPPFLLGDPTVLTSTAFS